MATNTLKAFISNFALLAMSLLVSFGLLELGATFLHGETEAKQDKEFDPARGWRYKPGSYIEKPNNSFVPHTIHINELGLRGPSPVPLDQNQLRVVVLGDSFTFGRAVPEAALYTAQLADMLTQRHPGVFQVVNAGVEGYGTAQQLFLLRELTARGVIGDFYVLQLFTNDILDNLRMEYSTLETQPLYPGFEIDEGGSLRLVYEPSLESWEPEYIPDPPRIKSIGVIRSAAETFAQSRPALINLAQRLGASVEVPKMPGVVNAWYESEQVARGLPLMKALVEEIHREIEKLNGRLVIAIIPSPMAVYLDTYGPMLRRAFPQEPGVEKLLRDPDLPQRKMSEICSELQVPCVNLFPNFIGAGERNLYIPREGHLTNQGHRIVATVLAELIEHIDGLGDRGYAAAESR